MSQPSIVVQKYGGSSVANPEKIRAVAKRIGRTVADGHRVCVVVSAMGDTTDDLLALARQITDTPERRELDMLLTAGERISMALLSLALNDLGVPSISFTGSQSGIITNDSHANARIVEVRPYRIQDELERGKVVIVAGYQGVSYRKEITTLGRGGSDTTAVALAAALGASWCEICSDVDGVYSADPRVVADARKLEELGYEEMQTLAESGARVLNATAVEFAREKGIALYARSTFSSGEGTLVRLDRPDAGRRVQAVASDDDVLLLRLADASVAEFSEVGGVLDHHGIGARTVTLQNGVATFLFAREDAHRIERCRQELVERFGGRVTLQNEQAIVSAVGVGILASHRTLQTALEALSTAGIPVAELFTSSLRLAFLVPKASAKDAVRALHAALIA